MNVLRRLAPPAGRGRSSPGKRKMSDSAGHASSVTTRPLNPELVHSEKRIRIVGLKACPVAQISAGWVAGKARAVPVKHTGVQFEADEGQFKLGKERLD